jgi:hypothetical protein
MGNLRPIGSEKLQGMDKINRIMEIARYKENRPNPINEDKSTEFSKKLSDGKTYRIDKEKNGYVIKRTINESTETFDYLEPMKNRKYYSSYSQAFKRLNLVVKEVNMSQGHQRNVSLFTESELDKELEEKRYYLNLGKKTEEKEQAPVDAAPAPAPAPVAAPAPAPTEEPSADLSGLDDMDLGAEVDTEEENGEEEKVTLKVIQKATGKLAQKIRAFGGEDDEELSSKDMKYVINSILSALDLDSLDEEDREEIMDKIEGVEEDEFGGSDEEGMGDEEEMGDDESVEPEAEMAEGFDDESMRNHFDDFDPKKFKKFPKNLDHSNLEKDSWSMDKFRKEFDKDEDDYENDYEDLYEDDDIDREDIDNAFEIDENEIDAPERIKTPERTRERETEREVERERRRKDRDDPFRPGKRPEERPAPRAGRGNDYDNLSSSAPRRHRINHKDIGRDEASKLEDMLEGMFTESKVDSVLKKYFKLEEKEKNVLKEQKENSSKVRNSSVNVVQEMVSMKIMKKYPTAKFLGRTKNNNLVFEHKNKQFRITPNGGIL